MTNQGRLLVARRSGDGQRTAEQGRIGLADNASTGNDGGQGHARHVEQGAQVVAPRDRLQIHQSGARCIGGVGRMDPAPGQIPDQPGVDGPQFDLAPRRAFAPAWNGVQQPGELGR